MIGFKIKVLKSKLESYWYANNINREYWARLDDNQRDYVIIPDGLLHTHNLNSFGDRCIISEDCAVEENSHILLNAYTSAIKLDR